MRITWSDVLFLVGCLLIIGGSYKIDPYAGVVATGAVTLILAFVLELLT